MWSDKVSPPVQRMDGRIQGACPSLIPDRHLRCQIKRTLKTAQDITLQRYTSAGSSRIAGPQHFVFTHVKGYTVYIISPPGMVSNNRLNETPETCVLCHVPAEVCLNFSLFFFLHFQGLRRRPRVANLLRRRMGGVWVPETMDSERMADSLSTSSAGREQNRTKKKKKENGSSLADNAEVAILWNSWRRACSERSRQVC